MLRGKGQDPPFGGDLLTIIGGEHHVRELIYSASMHKGGFSTAALSSDENRRTP